MNVIEDVKGLGFPAGEYAVMGGAVMGVHGIREAGDIDLLVTPELFERCKGEGWELKPWTKPGKEGKWWLAKGVVDLYTEVLMGGRNLAVSDLREDIETIGGVPCISLACLLVFKREYYRLFGRAKDLDDIALIEQAILENFKKYAESQP